MAIGTSIRQRIRDAVMAALNAGQDKPATACKARLDAFQPAELPAYALRFVDETGQGESHKSVARMVTIRVECHVAGQEPDDLLEPLLVYAEQAVFADAALLALITRIDEPAIGWDLEGAYVDGGMAYIDFPIRFAHARGDPTQ